VRQLGQVRQVPGVVERVQRAAYQRIAEIQAVHTAQRIAQILQIPRGRLELLKAPVGPGQRRQGEKVRPEHGRKTPFQMLR